MHTQVIYAPAFQRPSGKLYLGTNQLNLMHGAFVDVNLDTISANFSDNVEDVINHKITPGRAGLYLIVGQVSFFNVRADKDYCSYLELNDSTYISTNVIHAALAEILHVPVIALVWLSSNDYIKLIGMSNADVDTVDVVGQKDSTFLFVQRVR